MFLVNGMHAYVLFNSGASWSFLSLAFSKNFDIDLGTLDHPLEVEIIDECTIMESRVNLGCVLDMFGMKFSIEHVLISMGETRVIAGMDWLSQVRAMIDCERQLVRVRTLSEGELVVYGEVARGGPVICFVGMARRYLHHICSRFLAFIMDTRDKKKSLTNVPIVLVFHMCFQRIYQGCLMRWQVEFRINLCFGCDPSSQGSLSP